VRPWCVRYSPHACPIWGVFCVWLPNRVLTLAFPVAASPSKFSAAGAHFSTEVALKNGHYCTGRNRNGFQLLLKANRETFSRGEECGSKELRRMSQYAYQSEGGDQRNNRDTVLKSTGGGTPDTLLPYRTCSTNARSHKTRSCLRGARPLSIEPIPQVQSV
jgi:hypothetical protein